MRRKDFRGAKMWIVACSLMAVEMDSRTEEVKISRDWRLVIRRVLLGGVGCERGGRSEKSRDMLKERRFEGEEAGGVEMSMAMVFCVMWRWLVRRLELSVFGGGVFCCCECEEEKVREWNGRQMLSCSTVWQCQDVW